MPLRCASAPGAGFHPLAGVDHVGVPDIRADPAQVFRQLDRRATERGRAVGCLVLRLGQVGVQVNAVGACHLRALPHQLRRNGEGRAGRQHDAQHGVAARVVIGLDDALRVAQDGRLVLHNAVGRQAAL